MGTISGSGVANVVTVGQFTIPLMKRFGYKAAFAGGVEATASMGGQIMPPVMGAVAFIMAETINVPYAEIVKAAIIPAILYFALGVLDGASRGRQATGLHGMPRSSCRARSPRSSANWHLVLPLAVLVYLLLHGFTPLFAGSVGLALTVVLILGAPIARGFGRPGLPRRASGSRSASRAAAFLRATASRHRRCARRASLIAVNLFIEGGRETLVMLPRRAGGRRAPGAAGRPRLRHRRRHHRHA